MVFILSLILSVASAGITYPEIENLITTNKITTVEGFLKALPDSYKNQYTLLRKSSALQGANLESPRAVVYGQTGEMTLTFNSHPDLGGYDDVEFLAYDKDTKEFELRVITFQNNEVIFSEKNPTQCTHCHGIKPRPLWDNYPLWKHSFGARKDILTSEEEAILKSSLFRDHPRFKEIIKKDADPLFPFKDAPSTYGPNAMLGRLYTDLQGEANVERVLTSKGYRHSDKLGILALTTCSINPVEKRKLEDYYLLKIKELYPDQNATLEWWINKYMGEAFYLTLLKSIYLFGIDYFQNNYFNLKMRYHEEHLSSDSSMSVREATLIKMASKIENSVLKDYIVNGDIASLCEAILPQQ